MKTVLFFATTTGYQTRMFGEAAERLGVRLVFATDRCDQLDDPWSDRAIPIRFYQEAQAVDAVVGGLHGRPPDGLLVVGDRATVVAALAARRFQRPGHPPAAAAAARDKHLTRCQLRAAGMRVPWFSTLALSDDPARFAGQLPYPVVVKPLTLSASRGVIRADSPDEFIAAFARVARLLQSRDVRVMHDEATTRIQIESFIPGREYAVEGLLHHGQLHVLAIFDKPDPLDGPFFEETIYVTPPRIGARLAREIVGEIEGAIRALGLHHGPLHAECRINDEGVFVMEVAARPIGGLCARALAFDGPRGEQIGLEELLLRHALGESPAEWRWRREASGVMMIPIPRAGVYRRTDHLEAARAVPGITDLQITAKPDQQLVPLPEASGYLGFIFARGNDSDVVERALREAHQRLAFVIDRPVPFAGGV